MAVRMIRMLSSSSDCLPICAPPRPMRDTRTPVLPRMRVGISTVVTSAGGSGTWDSLGAVELVGPLFARHAASATLAVRNILLDMSGFMHLAHSNARAHHPKCE